MAAVKLNVFHWHLTEDQGFRIESKLYPKLTGTGSDGLFYTQDEARDIVAYARARGIRVVPEFDMPGHTRSWLVGYPELSSDPGPYTIRREFGVEAVAMDPTRGEHLPVPRRLLRRDGHHLPRPLPPPRRRRDPGTQWKNNPASWPSCSEHNFKTTDELQTYFSQRVLKTRRRHDKHMVGWDEILNPALPTDAIIHSWRGAKSLYDAAEARLPGHSLAALLPRRHEVRRGVLSRRPTAIHLASLPSSASSFSAAKSACTCSCWDLSRFSSVRS